MKKFLLGVFCVATAVFFYNCNSAKKAVATPPAALTYDSNLKTVIVSNCSPCHVPSKGGKVKSYENFANTKADIDDIIRRIELSPNEKGFMPFKHPKLSDSTIAVFKKWKADGMLEN